MIYSLVDSVRPIFSHRFRSSYESQLRANKNQDHHRYQISNQPPTIPTVWNNSNIGIYDSEFKGESEYQLCFLIEIMIL